MIKYVMPETLVTVCENLLNFDATNIRRPKTSRKFG